MCAACIRNNIVRLYMFYYLKLYSYVFKAIAKIMAIITMAVIHLSKTDNKIYGQEGMRVN